MKVQLDTTGCRVPQPGDLFASGPWDIPELQRMKARLDETKNLLDSRDTRCTNWAQKLVQQLTAQWHEQLSVTPSLSTM